MNLSGSAGTSVSPATFILNGLGTFTQINTATGTATEQVSQRWIATFRARAGFAATDRFLVFVTGGLAHGQVTSTGRVLITQPAFGNVVSWDGTTSTTRSGYAVGAGAEWAIGDNWSLKGEYLYYNLGRVKHPLNLTACSATAGCFPTLGNTTTRIDGGIARVGLNYRFNGPIVDNY